MRKCTVVFICCSAFMVAAFPLSVFAQLRFTEVMYDPDGSDAGREWVEISNFGSEDIDLTGWKLFESGVSHKMSGGSIVIPGGGFAIIADVPSKFMEDHSGFPGIVLDSAFSLGNGGEEIVLKDEVGIDVDSLSYDPEIGANNNGFSLQKTADSRWVAATPTPGSATVASETEVSDVPPGNSSQDGQSGGQDTSSHSSQAPITTKSEKIEFEITAGRPRLGFVGTPLEFFAKSIVKPSPTTTIDFAWSMGDGSMIRGPVISHAYLQPGRYTVILNGRAGTVEAVSKIGVDIRLPKAVVARANSRYIEIRNEDSYELNIGGWILEHGRGRFIVVRDTIISPNSSVRLPSEVTGFSDPSQFVLIADPLGTVISRADVDPEIDPVIILPPGMTTETIRSLFTDSIHQHEK